MTDPPDLSEYKDHTPRKKRPSMFTQLMAAYVLAGMNLRPSSADIRHDPDREKTPADLRAIERARAKREAKALRKQKNNSKKSLD